MSELSINRNIFLKTLNRLRQRLFGNDSMKIFGITPETGETQIAELFENWSGRRVDSTTDSDKDGGSWQFKVAADDDWQTSQAFMLRIVSFKIGDRRWKSSKVQKPIGNAKVWKIKAEIQ